MRNRSVNDEMAKVGNFTAQIPRFRETRSHIRVLSR